MSRVFDVVVIGAGPAGMSTAISLKRFDVSVLVVDEQSCPGGQIWREVEKVSQTPTGKLLGDEYQSGSKLVSEFRRCGAVYQPQTKVWKIESGWKVFLKVEGQLERIDTSYVVIATGAQERPAPFPGWTLPGVLTVGAAQVLLKNAQEIPQAPVWVVGSGPLTLLYMVQLLKAGGHIAGWIDTSASGLWRRVLPHLFTACCNLKMLSKGIYWLLKLRAAGVHPIRKVTSWKAIGNSQVEAIEYTTTNGEQCHHPAKVVLTHEGVIPQIYISQSLGCEHVWHAGQSCWVPKLNRFGETSQSGIFVAGDGANIGGVKLALYRGEQVALGIARKLERLTDSSLCKKIDEIERKSRPFIRLRPMLDAMYPPAAQIFNPADETIVCRCELLSAGDIRKEAHRGVAGCNQLKAFTRAGMGPCQGRQCGTVINHLIAQAQQKPVTEVETIRIRPPLKPITLGELATLHDNKSVIAPNLKIESKPETAQEGYRT